MNPTAKEKPARMGQTFPWVPAYTSIFWRERTLFFSAACSFFQVVAFAVGLAGGLNQLPEGLCARLEAVAQFGGFVDDPGHGVGLRGFVRLDT